METTKTPTPSVRPNAPETPNPSEQPQTGQEQPQERDRQFPWRVLPEIGTELASDMIMNGGRSLDVKLLVTALLRHKWRRKIPNFPRGDAEGQNTKAQEYANLYLDDTFRGLARHWPVPRVQPRIEPATTVHDMIGANVRDGLHSAFEGFMEDADPMDQWIMKEVLLDFSSGEQTLGYALSMWINSSDFYIRVPYGRKADVEQFIKMLRDEAA